MHLSTAHKFRWSKATIILCHTYILIFVTLLTVLPTYFQAHFLSQHTILKVMNHKHIKWSSFKKRQSLCIQTSKNCLEMFPPTGVNSASPGCVVAFSTDALPFSEQKLNLQSPHQSQAVIFPYNNNPPC